jgi:hypothetical protein
MRDKSYLLYLSSIQLRWWNHFGFLLGMAFCSSSQLEVGMKRMPFNKTCSG